MSLLSNVRMHGAANYFIIHFGNASPEQCLQNLEGADGLLLVQEDEEADAYMRIFNADGHEAEQCGNGLRCVALHLVRNKLVESPELTIRTLSGISHCVVREDCNEVSVTLCKPIIEKVRIDAFPNLVFVNTGNPNAVYWTKDDPISVRDELGETISNNASFNNGMNVHFARRDDDNAATIASWERGVGPTHASGTGGAAVFIAANAQGTFYVSSFGGTLSYRLDQEGSIVMAGPASYV